MHLAAAVPVLASGQADLDLAVDAEGEVSLACEVILGAFPFRIGHLGIGLFGGLQKFERVIAVLGGLGQLVARLSCAEVQNKFFDENFSHFVVELFLLLL